MSAQGALNAAPSPMQTALWLLRLMVSMTVSLGLALPLTLIGNPAFQVST